MDDCRLRCTEVFAKIMEIEPGSVCDETNPADLEQWDSLSHVQLIGEMEKEFAIEITPEEGIEIENFKMFVELVNSKLN